MTEKSRQEAIFFSGWRYLAIEFNVCTNDQNKSIMFLAYYEKTRCLESTVMLGKDKEEADDQEQDGWTLYNDEHVTWKPGLNREQEIMMSSVSSQESTWT